MHVWLVGPGSGARRILAVLAALTTLAVMLAVVSLPGANAVSGGAEPGDDVAIPAPIQAVAVVDTAATESGDLSAALAAPIPAGGRFFDDDGNVHEGGIEAIAAVGITLGCNPPYNTSYCPLEPVTRGQMAAFLVRALGLTDNGGGNNFIDDDGLIFEDHIARLAAAGITKGCNPPANDRFCPHAFVTRGQMAAFLVRALGLTDSGAGDFFVDDDGTVFEPSIDRLAVAGVTAGCNPPANDRYCPDSLVTRDQMATFLARALNLARSAVPERPIKSDGQYLNVFADAGNRGCDYHPDERCYLIYNVSGEFFIGTGWYVADWSQLSSAVQQSFRSDAVRVEASFDNVPLDLHDWGFEVDSDDVASKWWTFVFPDWLDGTHDLEVYLIDDDYDYLWTAVVSIRADGVASDAAVALEAGSSEVAPMRLWPVSR